MSQLKENKKRLIGIAKFDAGIRDKKPDYPPVDGGKAVIEKGRKYYVHETYNFNHKNAIFASDKPIKKEG